MNLIAQRGVIVLTALLVITPLSAADIKVDLGKERVGRTPVTFEPMVGTWVVAQDGKDKVIMVDGRPGPRRSPQNRPYVVTSKPAIGATVGLP